MGFPCVWLVIATEVKVEKYLRQVPEDFLKLASRELYSDLN